RPMIRPFRRHIGMAVPLLVLAAILMVNPGSGASADGLTGKLEKVEDGGSRVSIGGKTVAISGARTNVCIGGICDQGRDKLKPGLTCAAEVVDRAGTLEARRLSCK
ncbi:MAG: hypothetical protein AB7P12_02795, partial [Alphaproteobacteria bacterium]